jgi:DNA-binding Lrp family transcriptional regulator
MDALDVRIFCEMSFKYLDYNSFNRRHVSPSDIGKKVGAGEKTVRKRIKRMEDDKFIKYYQAVPNLSLFGLSSVGMYSVEALDVPSKLSALEELQQAKGVVEIFDMVGPTAMVTFAGETSVEVQRLVDEIVENQRLKSAMKVGDRTPRSPSRVPDRLDWKIVQRLRYDALCLAKDIGGDLSITPRMAEYRIARLLRTGALFIRAAINPQRQRGLIFFGLLTTIDGGMQSSVIGTLTTRYRERLWSVYNPTTGVIIANLFGFSIGEPEAAVADTLTIDGVRDCSLVLLKEVIESRRPNWLDSLIQHNI